MKSLAFSYLGLRRAIGIIGFLMPLVVELGARYFTGRWLDSVSASYYSVMRDVFVGSMFTIGTFLLFHTDTTDLDKWLGRVAGALAACIGLLPMDRLYEASEFDATITNVQEFCASCSKCAPCFTRPICVNGPVGYHMYVVIPFFALITIMVLFRFKLRQKKKPADAPPDQKDKRNNLYRVFGIIMLVSFVAIGVIKKLDPHGRIAIPEVLAIVSFSCAWLVKGQTILRDQA